MRIDPQNTRIGQELDAERVVGRSIEGAKSASADRGRESRGTDETILSPLAQDILHAHRAMAQVPEVRDDRVAEMRQQIANGTFSVTPELIADKLIEGGP